MWAKKSLGQNFLISGRIVEAIAMAGNLSNRDTVLEIGPGKGVLTKALLASGAQVIAIEKDDRLIPVLTEEFKKDIAEKRLTLIHGDVMDIDIDKSTENIGDAYKIIANIPYYITGALVRKFLSAHKKPSAMILMVQKEVATRILAHDKKESILSIAVKAYATPTLVMNVARGNFFPIPNVDSAVLKLEAIHDPFGNAATEKRFFEIVRAGFAQKRKKLSSNLEKVMSREDIVAKFTELGLEKNVRAEDVPLTMWISLAN